MTNEHPSPTRPIALITGGGTGIGAAIAKRLARDGFEVVVAGRRREKLESVVAAIEADGGAARAVVMDVTDLSPSRPERHHSAAATCSSTTPAEPSE